jgi:hypothetical protein
MGLILGLDYAVLFGSCFCVFVGLVFTGNVIGLRTLARGRRHGLLLAAGTFAVGCLFGAFLGVREAIQSFNWGFAVLGIGYLLSAAGLVVGAAGAVGLRLTGSLEERHRLSKDLDG